MKIAPHFPVVFTIMVFSFFYCAAQNDSIYIDLGRMKLRRDFTQVTTVKAKDLEHLSFTNLAEAVAAWFLGAYTNPSSIVYVIDGNVAGDANMYSIRDIEEISLVQHALVQLNGASLLRQVVLVTTKKTGKPSGITAAGETNVVFKKASDPLSGKMQETSPALFHRYYLSADKNSNKVQYGASLAYLRDAVPPINNEQYATGTPANFDRLQSNGYLRAALGKHNLLSLQANFTPQIFDFDQQYSRPRDPLPFVKKSVYLSKTTLFATALHWQVRLSKKWSNSLNVALNHFRISQHDRDWSRVDTSTADYNYTATANYRYYQIRNILSYSAALKNWQVVPTLNFTGLMGRHVHNRYKQLVYQGRVAEIATSASRFGHRFIQVTPMLSLSLPDKVNITGGLLVDVHSLDKDFKIAKRFFPFASATADLLSLGKKPSASSLKAFLSYAFFSQFTEPVYGFHETAYLPVAASTFAPHTQGGTGGQNPGSVFTTDSLNRMLSAGGTLALLHKRLNIQYSFEKRSNGTLISETVYNGRDYITIHERSILQSVIHRMGVVYTLFANPDQRWSTGFNYTSIKVGFSNPRVRYDPYRLLGDVHGGQTGGWTNRFYHKNLQLGFDVLYLLHEKIEPAFPSAESGRKNSLLLQHFYIGYQLQAVRSHPITIYLNSRNPLWDQHCRLNKDGRRFYGAGFEMKL